MMKKNNKKGFTLAELLIVIAIIAILIAIAIPSFSASLHSARLQTDHGNIRSAYAIFRTADMLGVIEADGSEALKPDDDADYYFQKDGSLSSTNNTEAAGAYVCMTDVETDGSECKESIGCKGNSHAKGAFIVIRYTQSSDKWEFLVNKTIS